MQQPIGKVLPPHGVHAFGELQKLHLLHLHLQILHEPAHEPNYTRTQLLDNLEKKFQHIYDIQGEDLARLCLVIQKKKIILQHYNDLGAKARQKLVRNGKKHRIKY